MNKNMPADSLHILGLSSYSYLDFFLVNYSCFPDRSEIFLVNYSGSLKCIERNLVDYSCFGSCPRSEGLLRKVVYLIEREAGCTHQAAMDGAAKNLLKSLKLRSRQKRDRQREREIYKNIYKLESVCLFACLFGFPMSAHVAALLAEDSLPVLVII